MDFEKEEESTYEEFLAEFDIVLNRIYNEHFQNPASFWTDLGMIFKNIQKHYSDSPSLLEIGSIYKELAYHLYRDWY